MKKSYLVLIVGILFLSLASGVQAVTLDITLISQNPYPVQPGQNVNIEVEIQNPGITDAKNNVVEIMVKDPFELLPGEEKIKTFTRIGAMGSVKTSYELHVDPEALTNNYEIEFRIYDGSVRDVYAKETVMVAVQGKPDLILDDVIISDNVGPGGVINMSVVLRNIGTGTAHDLLIHFNSSSELIPVLSKGLIYMGDLGPDQTGVANMQIAVDSQAEHKTYQSTITATYLDENNTETEETFSIGVPVIGSVILDIINIESDFDRNELKIDVANKGTTEAKSLEAKLTIDGNVIGIDYTSRLRENKLTTFSFPLVLTGSGNLEINYIGPGLEQSQVTKDIVLNYQTQNGGNWAVITMLIVIVLVFLFWQRAYLKRRFLEIFKNKKP